MLTSEFLPEMGALLRSLEARVRNEPNLRHEDLDTALAHIERAIVILTALHLSLRSKDGAIGNEPGGAGHDAELRKESNGTE